MLYSARFANGSDVCRNNGTCNNQLMVLNDNETRRNVPERRYTIGLERLSECASSMAHINRKSGMSLKYRISITERATFDFLARTCHGTINRIKRKSRMTLEQELIFIDILHSPADSKQQQTKYPGQRRNTTVREPLRTFEHRAFRVTINY